MMNRVLIACRTLHDELKMAMRETGCGDPIIWMDSDYHLDPNRLRVKLQEIIDGLQNIDVALFVYGCCGNGLINLKATTADLIIPKTDDCISIIMSRPNEKFKRKKETYFLTKGWIEFSKGLMNEYHHTLECYGEQRTKRIFEMMLKHYLYLMLIDTKAYKIDHLMADATDLAKKVDLELVVSEGSLWYLKQLLTGPYDDHFCVVPKGQKVTLRDFGYKAAEDTAS